MKLKFNHSPIVFDVYANTHTIIQIPRTKLNGYDPGKPKENNEFLQIVSIHIHKISPFPYNRIPGTGTRQMKNDKTLCAFIKLSSNSECNFVRNFLDFARVSLLCNLVRIN